MKTAAAPHAERTPRPRHRLRQVLVNSLLLMVSTLVSLTGIELAARALLGDGPVRVQLFEPHPGILYRLKPGFEGTLSIPLYDFARPTAFPVSISSQGFRDRAVPPKLPGEYRVFMLGDSFTFGWGLTASESIPRRLEAALQARYPDRVVSVVNGGVTGYGPWQSHGLFLECVDAIAPDLVILQTFTANDLADTLVAMPEALETHEGVRPWRLRSVRRLMLQEHRICRTDQWLLGHSWIYFYGGIALGEDLLLTRAYNRLGLGEAVEIPALPHAEKRPYAYEPDRCVTGPQMNRAWEHFEADIRALHASCRDRGMAFATYNIPYPIDFAMATATVADYPPGTYCPDLANRHVDAFFAAARIPHAPMLDVVRAHPLPDSLFFPANGHLNDLGVRLTVDMLLDTFFQGGLEAAGDNGTANEAV